MNSLKPNALYVTDNPFLEEPRPRKDLFGLAMIMTSVLAAIAMLGAAALTVI